MTQLPASRAHVWIVMICCLLWPASGRAFANDDAATLPESQQAEFFESKIRPALIEHCYACHNSSDNAEGGLAVDHRDAVLQGGDGGIILKSGDPAGSRLLAILKHEIDGLEMPAGGPKLDDSVIADFQLWIANGAYDPRDTAPDADSLAALQSWEALLERRKAWWSFQKIVDHLPPTTGLAPEFGAVNLNPIDRFVYAKLSNTTLRPNPPADSATLVRRLFFALIGLPPTSQQSQLWTTRIDSADLSKRDAVIETLVDELLASPQFGPRWARHWMDWIRYAESHGSEGDPAIDNALMSSIGTAAALFANWNAAPTTVPSLDAAIVDVLRQAILAWQQGTLDDHQALFLNRCLQEGILANRIADLPGIETVVKRYRELESDIPVPRRIPSLDETAGRDQPLMIRGNHKTLGESIPRRFLEAIDSSPYGTSVDHDPNVTPVDASGRLRLAEDLLRDDNPLTRRVIANRIWHHLFGRGIVSTPDNLGRLGDTPTHPELLDWLAVRLPENQWSLKQLIRTLVTSKTWQASSTPSPEAITIDPDNRLWSHARLNRLEAEAIRDSLLSVSGSIDLTPLGPPVSGNSARRSIYVGVRRNSLDPFLRVFDFPEPFSATGRRDSTNVPAQSLTIMNDPRVVALATSWATKVLGDQTLQNDRQRVDQMFRSALGRPALDSELSQTLQFLDQSKQLYSELRNELDKADATTNQARARIEAIMTPMRQKLVIERESRSTAPDRNLASIQPPTPIRAGDFAEGANDMIASSPLTMMGDAKINDAALMFEGNGYAVTQPLDVSLRAKTIEAWVRLSDTSQRGGGVITIQTLDGNVFDSIVFGEKSPGQWLAGSNNFARTESFDGEAEKDAMDQPVQITIVYEESGRITAYRNGTPYGKPYKSRGIQPFAAGQSILSFGVRHLPAGGNRMLKGTIHQARLYHAALSAEEVRASFEVGTNFVSDATVIDRLTSDQRNEIERLRVEIARTDELRSELGSNLRKNDTEAVWADLAHSLITLPEFIYVR